MRTYFLLVVLWALSCVAAWAQQRISGKVLDAETGIPLPYASVLLEGSTVGVVANEEGAFVLSVPASFGTDGVLVVSYVGYRPERRFLADLQGEFVLELTPESVVIPEVAIEEAAHRLPLIIRVLNRIDSNYAQIPVHLTGFYRNRLILNATEEEYLFTEAVLEMYKAPYDYSFDTDQVKLIKGRRKPVRNELVSRDGRYSAPIPYLVSGPQAGIKLDIVAQRPPFFNALTVEHYLYTLTGETLHENRPVYILTYTPRTADAGNAHSSGTLYIDQQTLALVRAEIDMHPSHIAENNRDGSELITLQQHHSVQYRLVENLWYLQYVKSETQYRSKTTDHRLTLKLEFLSTELRFDDVQPYKRREILDEADVLEQFVGQDDDRFWESYNIIR